MEDYEKILVTSEWEDLFLSLTEEPVTIKDSLPKLKKICIIKTKQNQHQKKSKNKDE